MSVSRGVWCSGRDGFPHEPSDNWSIRTIGHSGSSCVECSRLSQKIRNDYVRNEGTKGTDAARIRLEQWESLSRKMINREPPTPKTPEEIVNAQLDRIAKLLENNDGKSYTEKQRLVQSRHVQEPFKIMHRAWWEYCRLTMKVDKTRIAAEFCDAAHRPEFDWKKNPEHNGLMHGILVSPNIHEFMDREILIPKLVECQGILMYHFVVVKDLPSDAYAWRYHNQHICLPHFPKRELPSCRTIT